jgi:hypothetical protein
MSNSATGLSGRTRMAVGWYRMEAIGSFGGGKFALAPRRGFPQNDGV